MGKMHTKAERTEKVEEDLSSGIGTQYVRTDF